MVKDNVLTYCGQPKRPTILTFRYVKFYIYIKILLDFWVQTDYSGKGKHQNSVAAASIFSSQLQPTYIVNAMLPLWMLQPFGFSPKALKCFPPSLPLALSVVSMEVFAPHKMAEIKPKHL